MFAHKDNNSTTQTHDVGVGDVVVVGRRHSTRERDVVVVVVAGGVEDNNSRSRSSRGVHEIFSGCSLF
jgi:hypothetical protein